MADPAGYDAGHSPMEHIVSDTPQSLLERLRKHPDDQDAWQRFDDLYRPLLASWIRRYSVQPHDGVLVSTVVQPTIRPPSSSSTHIAPEPLLA